MNDLNKINQFLLKRAMDNASKAIKNMEFETDPTPVALEDLQVPKRRAAMNDRRKWMEENNETYDEFDELPPEGICEVCGETYYPFDGPCPYCLELLED